jgi:hypothetical protein
VQDFNAKVRRFANRLVPELVGVFYRRISLEILRGVVFLTPVDTGRARGNWQLTLVDPANGERSDWDKRDPVREGAALLAAMKELQVVWVSNNVSYIRYLEQGSSDQSPAGMLAVTMNAIGSKLG